MGLEVNFDEDQDLYWISLEGEKWLFLDSEIASYLELSLSDYQYFLQNNGAKIFNYEYYFECKLDAQLAIEQLEPYLMLKKLEG